MYLTVDMTEKNMTQIFETHLYLTAGIHGEVGIVSGQV